MSAALAPTPVTPTVEGWPTLRALAWVEAKRFARHPLFLLGVAILLVYMGYRLVARTGGGATPLSPALYIAFLLGVLGFVVAHRLTTSLSKTRDLADTAPVDAQMRTLSLCIACLVPALAGTAAAIFMLVTSAIWEPHGTPASATVSWFADERDTAVLAALFGLGPVSAAGGPLLGIAVARRAPFRGSALVGVVALVFVSMAMGDASHPWTALSPWPILVDEHVDETGAVATSFLIPGVSASWILVFQLCLCGLAVVAAVLRDRPHRRALLWTGVALTIGATGSWVLAVS